MRQRDTDLITPVRADAPVRDDAAVRVRARLRAAGPTAEATPGALGAEALGVRPEGGAPGGRG
ncbi:hypothetical protein ACFCYH_18910 [Streptomyces sp. NPDC056400]|uniref:hypothetical protein n=1 Tax=Streptomyces sp. NPDC056400 TaxID=3345808 RepID=UPI0035D6C066